MRIIKDPQLLKLVITCKPLKALDKYYINYTLFITNGFFALVNISTDKETVKRIYEYINDDLILAAKLSYQVAIFISRLLHLDVFETSRKLFY